MANMETATAFLSASKNRWTVPDHGNDISSRFLLSHELEAIEHAGAGDSWRYLLDILVA